MASVIFPKTSTRIGPKSLDMRSRELKHVNLDVLIPRIRRTCSPAIHIFHAQDNVPCLILKRTIKRDHVGGTAIVSDLQFSDDLLSHVLLGINSNDLCLLVSLRVTSRRARSWGTGALTFLAMITLVEACMTLLTVPPFPAPSSFKTMRSSLRRSSLNSNPISNVSVRSLSELPHDPGICESPSDGLAVRGGGAFSAKPFTFFLFNVLVLNGSDMLPLLS